jgi:hypothetical protein
MKKRTFAWLLALAAGIGIGYLIFSPAKESIDEAHDKQHVAVDIQASDETSATVKVRKLQGSPSKLTVVIPEGTVILNGDPDGQALMTAHAVTIHLSDSAPESTQQIETYCLHQFAAPPTLTSNLYLPSGAYEYSRSGVEVEEMEPLQKLVSCLADRTDSRTDRELAVWMLADGRDRKSYEQVRAELRDRYKSQGESGLGNELMGDIREKLRRQFPNLSAERLEQEIGYYRQTTLEKRISDQAEQKATEEIKSFLQVARPLLEKCGRKPGEMKFFQTAPQAWNGRPFGLLRPLS